ncbi:DUF692 domain-containing protein [bacterium]|nr:DUF692 domain-containing protein [bacterium]
MIGLGLRTSFIEELEKTRPPGLNFLEIAPENYIGRGGWVFEAFQKLSTHYPIFAHGLSLSIGSLDPLNISYLKKLKEFLDTFRITYFSDHLCFQSFGGHYFNELLPLPFTQEAIKHVVPRIKQVQDILERRIALENITYYFTPQKPEMTEAEFITEVIRQSGCELLLDINNVYVNAHNHNTPDTEDLKNLMNLPIASVHIAGHVTAENGILIDNHGATVKQDVWRLYQIFKKEKPHIPVVLERDNNIPSLDYILEEIALAS